MKSVIIPPYDMQLIEVTIDSMTSDYNHKMLDINNIMKEMDTYYFSNKLDTYKPFIIEYANHRNKEAEVMHIDFDFNHTFIHIIIFYTEKSFHGRERQPRYSNIF